MFGGIKSAVFKIKISTGFTAVLFFEKRKLSIEKTANLLKLENLKKNQSFTHHIKFISKEILGDLLLKVH